MSRPPAIGAPSKILMDYVEFNRKHGALYERIPGSRISLLAEYGPEVGVGWLPFLDSIFTQIEREISASDARDFEVIEIKEKWGRLRILWRDGNDRTLELLDQAEELSGRVCDVCGAFGMLRKFDDAWYATVCGDCADERGGHRIIWEQSAGN